jgi:hypothetical protein
MATSIKMVVFWNGISGTYWRFREAYPITGPLKRRPISVVQHSSYLRDVFIHEEKHASRTYEAKYSWKISGPDTEELNEQWEKFKNVPSCVILRLKGL